MQGVGRGRKEGEQTESKGRELEDWGGTEQSEVHGAAQEPRAAEAAVGSGVCCRSVPSFPSLSYVVDFVSGLHY